MKLHTLLSKKAEFSAPALPVPKALHGAREAILNRWPDVVKMPPESDRERLVKAMLLRLQSGQWDDTPMSLVTSAARALFDAERRARPDLEKLREFYFAEILASDRQTFLDAMFSVYIATYAPDAPNTRRLASVLNHAKLKLGGRSQLLLRNIPDILHAHKAPEVVATLMMQMDDCWIGLKELGLRSPHAPGLMDHAHLAFVDRIGPVAEMPRVEKLFNWLKPAGQSARISGASEAITAILAPWLNTEPRQQQLTFLTESLIGLYGDPRVQRGGAWAGVPTAHMDVLMRWLTGLNILFFLEAIAKSESSHMFEPRRRFWLGLHEKRRIDAAWVAFSVPAAEYARRELSNERAKGRLEFGVQADRGNRRETSLLILQIGNKVVVEGSHSYRVHIFDRNRLDAPKLYEPIYSCNAILKIPNFESRVHDTFGHWQDWVLERI